MSEMSEDFAALKAYKQEKRSSNRGFSANLLLTSGVIFKSKNGGAHLIVEGAAGTIDFWPGTGKWIARYGISGRGVQNLLHHLKQKESE